MVSRYSSGAGVVLESDFADAADRGERRAEFVRGVGGEALQLLEGLLDAGEHRVEDSREVAEFALFAFDGQALVEMLGINLLGAMRHLRDGIERAADRGVNGVGGAGEDQRRRENQDEKRSAELDSK